MENPLFSVIIPTYNSYEKLLRALNSLQKQSYQDFEIIVVDDGSYDETREKIQLLLSSKTRYFYKTNGGPASARNLGIKQAKGKFICFLDADDTFEPDKLLMYSKFCKEDVVFIFSDAWYVKESSGESSLFSSKKLMKYSHMFESLLFTNFIVASTVCVKKTVLEDLTFFDEKLFAEDYDLWLKIARNYPLIYVEQPLTNYYIHELNISKNVKRTVSSLLCIYAKWIFVSPIALKNFMKYTLVWLLYVLRIKK